MESGPIRTLLNLLFLSSLECVLGSVVRQHSHYNSYYYYTWTNAEANCRSRSMALLTQQFEFDKSDITTVTYHTWIGLKGQGGQARWSDGTYYNDPPEISQYETCAYLTSPSHAIAFGSCHYNFFFYCKKSGPSHSSIVFVPRALKWEDAETYCRDNYIDLVLLKDEDRFDDLPNDDLFYIWTGIHRSNGGDWKSSTGLPIDENWKPGQPTANGDCVATSNKDMKMINLDCDTLWPFYCFQDNLVLVKEDKTWEEALEHCRAMDLTDPNNHRNDLISISGPLDQQIVWTKIDEAITNEIWTGLRYFVHEWFWVDGTDVPYQDLPSCPVQGQYCGTLVRDNSTIPWNIRDCNEKRNFLCYKKY
ncbi:uncharacterized protein LOC132472095 [Gadus macrocephalus]|uniref:uncharacterized protein LOC132472095 n=1 Tax=Gadus macrocephalus TaxID=80720 RepID=UPI0028CB4DDE|nr:uncharacterized protein LOC132472095 [Gadus macrocephalus]